MQQSFINMLCFVEKAFVTATDTEIEQNSL